MTENKFGAAAYVRAEKAVLDLLEDPYTYEHPTWAAMYIATLRGLALHPDMPRLLSRQYWALVDKIKESVPSATTQENKFDLLDEVKEQRARLQAHLDDIPEGDDPFAGGLNDWREIDDPLEAVESLTDHVIENDKWHYLPWMQRVGEALGEIVGGECISGQPLTDLLVFEERVLTWCGCMDRLLARPGLCEVMTTPNPPTEMDMWAAMDCLNALTDKYRLERFTFLNGSPGE